AGPRGGGVRPPGAPRPQLVAPAKLRQGRREPPLPLQDLAEVASGLRVARVQAEGLAVLGLRAGELVLELEEQAEVVVGRGELRVQANRLAELVLRLRELPEVPQRV